jgi:DNA-binding CsgD family transcriptional regulator
MSKRVLLVLFLFSFSIQGFVYSQKSTYKTVVKEINEGSAKTQDVSAFLEKYTKEKLTRGSFESKHEWVNSLNFIEQSASSYSDIHYFRILNLMASRLRNNNYEQEGYYFLYKAKDLENTLTNIPEEDLKFYYENLGLSDYYFGRYQESEKNTLKALNVGKLTFQDSIHFMNTLGLINSSAKNYPKASNYFETALKVAKLHNVKPWIALISGNLGNIYYKLGDYKKARPLVQKDYTLSMEAQQKGSALSALSILINMDIDDNLIEKSNAQFKELEKLFATEKDLYTKRFFLNTKTKLLEANHNYKEALTAYKEYVENEDSIAAKKDIEKLGKTEFQINFEQEAAKVKLLKEKKKRSDLYLIIALILVTLVSTAAWIIIVQIRKRRKENEAHILLEKEQLNKELQSAEREMRQILTNLIEKNEMVELLNKEIEGFQLQIDQTEDEEKKHSLQDKLQSFILLSDDDWLEFKKLFNRLNPGYFDRLFELFPDLTNGEIRLVTLIKLNLGNLEISRALGISPDSVRKTSLRLRKKLNIEQHDDLVLFFKNI